MVHENDPRVGGHGLDERAEDLDGIFITIIVHDHAQKVDGGALDGLGFEEAVLDKLEARSEVFRHHAGRRVFRVVDDLGEVLHDDADARVGLGDGDGAVAHVARDVDDDGTLREAGPVEPLRDVLVGHDGGLGHEGHDLAEALAHRRVGLVPLVLHLVRVEGVVECRLVGFLSSVSEVVEGVDHTRGHGERVLGDEVVEGADAPVRQKSRRCRVCDQARRGFVKDVDRHELAEHLFELGRVQRQFGSKVGVCYCRLEWDVRWDVVSMDVAERIEIVSL